MSEHLVKFAKHDARQRRRDLPKKDGLNVDERRALKTIQREAKAAGSELTSQGRGGLPPSLVLGCMRRDKFCCKKCGELGNLKENGGIGVHHKSEHLNDPKAKARSALLGKEGKIDTKGNIATLCNRCHDSVHEKDREEYGK